MTRRSWTVLLITLGLLVGSFDALAQGPLSNQVLQLLTRTNNWIGTNTFLDLRLFAGTPSDTTRRIYSDNAGNLYYSGTLIAGVGGVTNPHNLLSTTHPDTAVAAVSRGGIIIGNSTPAWSRLTVGTAGQFLRADGTDVAWGTNGSALTNLDAAQLTGTAAAINGSLITALNASNLASGTVPLARLTGITFTQWASNGCGIGNYPSWSGAAWVCAVAPGAGTVTSVGLSLPAIFTVSGTPVTTSGTLTGTLATQTANLLWAGPTSGGAAAPTFRTMVNADLPLTGVGAGTYTKVTVATSGVVSAASTQITLTTDVTGILPMANGGTGVGVSADDSVLIGSGTAWVAQSIPNCTTGAIQYTQATNLFSCGTVGGPSHALLSATHTDTLPGTVARGDLIVGNSTSVWARLPVPAPALLPAGRVLTLLNGTDPTWAAGLDAGTLTGAGNSVFTMQAVWNNGASIFKGLVVQMTPTAASGESAFLSIERAFNTPVVQIRRDGSLAFVEGVLFANLNAPYNGLMTFCTDCTFANPCAGGGTGAIAKRLNGAWRCD